MKKRISIVWIFVVATMLFFALCPATVFANEESYQAETVVAEAETVVADESLEEVTTQLSDLDIYEKIEIWQDYLDKYVMPNAIAVLTGISMVLAVFSKFKTLVNLYKEDKDAFDAEKEEIFSQLKSEVENITSTLADVKSTTLASIDNMPIATIQEDIAKAKEALETEMESIQDFTKMFEIFLQSERKLVDTSSLSSSEKMQMKKLFYKGEQLAKKNQTNLSDVSDFVLATISSESEEEVAESEDLGDNAEVEA